MRMAQSPQYDFGLKD